MVNIGQGELFMMKKLLQEMKIGGLDHQDVMSTWVAKAKRKSDGGCEWFPDDKVSLTHGERQLSALQSRDLSSACLPSKSFYLNVRQWTPQLRISAIVLVALKRNLCQKMMFNLFLLFR